MTAFRIVIAAFIGLCSISGFGQIPAAATNKQNSPDQSQTANDPNAMQNGAQTPGQDAQSTPSGPDIVDDPNATPEQKASAEYSGPAVLSRAISASEPMNPKNTKFMPTIGINYVYTSGLTGVALSNGQFSNANGSGIQLTYGLTGTKIYKKDMFSVNFAGSLYNYPQVTGYNGSTNTLGLAWKHTLTRHLSFGVHVSGQEFNQNNLLLTGAEYVNSGLGTTLITATPATEAFDGRVISFATEGNLTYQMTSRLSINLSGGGFLTRRESSSLFGDTGYQAGADIAYRITRHVTTGIYYQYTHFDYIGTIGGSDVETVGLTYSIAFTPTTELITRLGGSRVETLGLTTVALDPVLAVLFGSGSAQEVTNLVNYSPDFNVQLRHKVSNWMYSLSYARGITPGNGLILTSARQTGSAGADRKIGRKWSFSGSGGYDSLSSFGTTNEKYESVFLSSSLSRTILKNVAWNANFIYHRYLFDNTGFLRNSFTLSTGLSWTPGDLLERIW